jgi:hypothetical protein
MKALCLIGSKIEHAIVGSCIFHLIDFPQESSVEGNSTRGQLEG